MPSDFELLRSALQNDDMLLETYDRYLAELFSRPFWTSGSGAACRIKWLCGKDARREERQSFENPGVYIWGIEERPLYIGITSGKFSRRFSRYIWSERSQCNLAQEYAPRLIADGIQGFPLAVRDWYARHYRGSTVRLRGAVRFANEGIDDVWFALLPHTNKSEIKVMEPALIRVAQRWNENKGFGSLLNVEFNREAKKAYVAHGVPPAGVPDLS